MVVYGCVCISDFVCMCVCVRAHAGTCQVTCSPLGSTKWREWDRAGLRTTTEHLLSLWVHADKCDKMPGPPGGLGDMMAREMSREGGEDLGRRLRLGSSVPTCTDRGEWGAWKESAPCTRQAY